MVLLRYMCGSDVKFFFFSSRRRHTRLVSDWSSDVCSSDLYFHNDDDEDDDEVFTPKNPADSKYDVRIDVLDPQDRKSVV